MCLPERRRLAASETLVMASSSGVAANAIGPVSSKAIYALILPAQSLVLSPLPEAEYGASREKARLARRLEQIANPWSTALTGENTL
jgi:hypothetical protein